MTGAELGPGPIRLADHQRRIMRAALERDGEGRFRWTTVLWSCPKKSGKTRIAAVVAAWLATTSGKYAEVYCLANDGKQSADRVLAAVKKANELGRLGWRDKMTRVELPGGAFIEAVPVDPSGEAGANPTASIWSEMWGFRLSAKEQLWSEFTISPTRFGRAIRWVESYAGYAGESPVLEQLYDLGVKQGKPHPDFPDLPVTVNESASLFCYWDHEPRMPWQTPAYYQNEAAILSESEFRRIHRNEWVTSEETFVPAAWWDACQESLPPLVKGESLVLGVDAAVSGDSFAVVGVSRHPQRHDDVAVRYVRIWYPPKGGKLDYAGPEEEIARLCREYKVVEVAYDPYQLHKMATDQARARIANWQEFGQQGDRLTADATLYQLIRDRRIAHTGEPDLREHVLAANSKSSDDSRLRIVKGRGYIDGCVAMSMAAHRCLYLRL